MTWRRSTGSLGAAAACRATRLARASATSHAGTRWSAPRAREIVVRYDAFSSAAATSERHPGRCRRFGLRPTVVGPNVAVLDPTRRLVALVALGHLRLLPGFSHIAATMPRFTRERSLVRNQPRPSDEPPRTWPPPPPRARRTRSAGRGGCKAIRRGDPHTDRCKARWRLPVFRRRLAPPARGSVPTCGAEAPW